MADISNIKLPNNINYTIKDSLAIHQSDIVTLTKAEYDNLPDTKLTDGKYYLITDIDSLEPYEKTVYGWRINPGQSDPSSAVTYVADAVGMTPAYMEFGVSFHYGSWKDAFFMPKPCMVKYDGTVDYYLNPDDYSKKVDGTASDIANLSYRGNAMMEWPLIWYKFEGTDIDGEGYFYVSNTQVDDTYRCWCNINADNNIIEHFYTAIYNGTRYTDSVDGNVKLRSMSGVTLNTTNSATYDPTASAYATTTAQATWAMNNDTTSKKQWFIEVLSDRLLINALLILIGKSLNCQSVFGRGVVDSGQSGGGQSGAESYVTGQYLNARGLFFGASGSNLPVKVFGMENWWGLLWHRTAGCITNGTDLFIKLTRGISDGSTLTDYIINDTTPTSPSYIHYGIIINNSGYIKRENFNSYGMFPSLATGGSSTTYYSDYYTFNNGVHYARFGADASSGVGTGMFNIVFYGNASNKSWGNSATLSLKP